MPGLSEAGKTTLLSNMTGGAALCHFDSNRETFDVSGMTLVCWELYGRDKARPMFPFYSRISKGLIYVIDSSDTERLDEALDEVVKYVLLEKDMAGTVVMVLANKQDIPGAMTALEIQEALKQKYTFSSTSAFAQTVFVRPCSVLTMEGVNEAFEEFVEQLRLRDAGKAKPGLIPLVGEGGDVNIKDSNLYRFDVKNQKESLARAKMKSFFKNPFCLFRAVER